MKVVLAHKFYRLTGGTEQYFRDLAAILEGHGHQTIPFALSHPANPPTPYAKYFLEDIDYRSASALYRIKNLGRTLSRTLYSMEARCKMDALIRDIQPDLAHIQSIEHHISPSILHSFKAHNIPIVQSVNTYKLICASYRLYLLKQGELCERCLYGKHYHAALVRCIKGSLPASLLASVEMYLHQAMKIYHLVDRFIVSSHFMREKLIGAGFDPDKVVRLLNPLTLDAYEPNYEFDDYILYFGRVDPEKGVLHLADAMRRLPKLKLVVVGDGAALEEVVEFTRSHRMGNVEFAGPKWGADLIPYLKRARLVVVPSTWYEPSPMVIYQSLATGKPVIGARIGGIPDLITPETGLLFSAGDVDDLAAKIGSVAFDDDRLRAMGQAARAWAERNLDPQAYYDSIMDVYSQALEEKRI